MTLISLISSFENLVEGRKFYFIGYKKNFDPEMFFGGANQGEKTATQDVQSIVDSVRKV